MSAVFGVVVGLVTDVDDPSDQGRVRLRFPWLTDDDAVSGWAPVVRTMAGPRRGYWFAPEVDDEALVAFEQGDVDHPFVLGFLHNGVDQPPDDGIDKHVRRIRSVSGHVLELDDSQGKERVLLKTQGGHLVEMKDADGTVRIATTGGQVVKLEDDPAQIKLSTTTGTSVTIADSPSQVQVSTVGGVTVTVSDTGVDVSSATGAVSVTSLSASVTAASSATVTAPSVEIDAATLTVNSALATFTGVVNCTTLVATSVVSSSYTPGAGNIW